jgi:hypothetical protein
MGLLGVARAKTTVGVSPETFLLLLLHADEVPFALHFRWQGRLLPLFGYKHTAQCRSPLHKHRGATFHTLVPTTRPKCNPPGPKHRVSHSSVPPLCFSGPHPPTHAAGEGRPTSWSGRSPLPGWRSWRAQTSSVAIQHIEAQMATQIKDVGFQEQLGRASQYSQKNMANSVHSSKRRGLAQCWKCRLQEMRNSIWLCATGAHCTGAYCSVKKALAAASRGPWGCVLLCEKGASRC